MENVIFHPVKGFEGLYEISNVGDVRTVERLSRGRHQRLLKPKFLKAHIDRAGYYSVKLSKEKNTNITCWLHRLVAEAFISNPINKCCVNHKNGIKTDNLVENLEWCTHSENMIHAYNTGLLIVPEPNKRKIIDVCTQKKYDSVVEAAKQNDINIGTLRDYLSGKRKNKTCLQYFSDAA